jgi:hypothetical protein
LLLQSIVRFNEDLQYFCIKSSYCVWRKREEIGMGADRKPDFFTGKEIKIGIIGCGYVGLPLALRFADVGQLVTGFDTDEEKIKKLNDGQNQPSRAGQALQRHHRFFTVARNGCGAHLRPHPA